MAKVHVRSKSLPTEAHPAINDVEDQLRRLKSSEAASTSASTICLNLDSLRNLHEDINDLMQLPSIQEVLSNKDRTSGLLDESLVFVDLCGFTRDIVCLTKECVQELQSSIRRNRRESPTEDEINVYKASIKKIKKMISSYIKKKSKSFNQNLELSNDPKGIVGMLRETDAFSFSVLQSVLSLVSPAKKRWSLLSKFTQSGRVHSAMEKDCDNQDFDIHASQRSLKQLKALEMMAQELEEGLESLFRNLVKTRVSLLNSLNH